MRRLVDSFKRLYEAGRITKERLQTLLEEGTITQEEYDYIVSDTI